MHRFVALRVFLLGDCEFINGDGDVRLQVLNMSQVLSIFLSLEFEVALERFNLVL